MGARQLLKIDQQAVSGLLGTSNSLAYKVHEIEKHFHGYGRWYGKSADQSGNGWALSVSTVGMPTSFTCISGANTYGADANDEAKVWGTEDLWSGNVKFELHRILIRSSSIQTLWIIRVVHGSGTMADAVAAEQYSEFPMVVDPATGASVDVVVDIMMPRITLGTDKIWIQGKSATDNATLTFLIGGHGYAG